VVEGKGSRHDMGGKRVRKLGIQMWKEKIWLRRVQSWIETR
jgi:hypothetical protein